MHLIVGLGNVGEKYQKTRHNVGFMIVDSYAKKQGVSFQRKKECLGSVALIQNEDQHIVLLKPSTYMNLSGDSVVATLKYFNVVQESLLVVFDDANRPLDYVQFRPFGGTGGHKGLKSIDQRLKNQQYARVHVGIGRDPMLPLDVYVLSSFSNEEVEQLIIKEGIVHQIFDEWSKGEKNV